MSAGFHLDLFAYDQAEAIQQEAREMARSADFAPPVISTSVDLLFTYVRRHEAGRAEQIRGEVSDTIAAAGGVAWLAVAPPVPAGNGGDCSGSREMG